MSDNRKFEREKRRISCEFRTAGLSHMGLVSDLSARGLFIQSSRMPDDGAQLDVLLHDSEFGEIQLWGRVVRTKSPHRSLANIDPGGFGVVIESASEDFFRLVTLRQD
ncbi:MAG: PilZ domain-containing protein [Myxococcota bacterium]